MAITFSNPNVGSADGPVTFVTTSAGWNPSDHEDVLIITTSTLGTTTAPAAPTITGAGAGTFTQVYTTTGQYNNSLHKSRITFFISRDSDVSDADMTATWGVSQASASIDAIQFNGLNPNVGASSLVKSSATNQTDNTASHTMTGVTASHADNRYFGVINHNSSSSSEADANWAEASESSFGGIRWGLYMNNSGTQDNTVDITLASSTNIYCHSAIIELDGSTASGGGGSTSPIVIIVGA